jgi:predicted component of viral defense system (DUF524 family)
MDQVPSVRCGRYTVIGGPKATIGLDGGDVVLLAEEDYTVRLPAEGGEGALRGALSVLAGATEGRLRFGNFIGRTELDGRPIVVRSWRASDIEMDAMLEFVSGELGSLPTASGTPSGSPYDRLRWDGSDVDYQAYVTVRDALVRRRPHDLVASIERILARPHERFVAEERTVPLGRVDRIDGRALFGIVARPYLLVEVPTGHPLDDLPIARALGGRLPDRVLVRRPVSTTDTVENRFVRSVLDLCMAIVRAVERAAAVAGAPASAALAREAHMLTVQLERWTGSRVLEPLPPVSAVPATSTVLRGRAGYREVLRFFADLMGRSQRVPATDAERLVGLRDVATIYEYWCYFTFVRVLESVLGESAALAATPHSWSGPGLVHKSAAAFPSGARVLYNRTFSRSSSEFSSYSVPFRPDITLELPSGERHLFDAKFAFEPGGAGEDEDLEDDDAAPPQTRARRAHLHKMHAYRDAIGARSVWVLYPGSKEESFPSLAAGAGKIGAIPLRLGASVHTELTAKLRQVIANAKG